MQNAVDLHWHFMQLMSHCYYRIEIITPLQNKQVDQLTDRGSRGKEQPLRSRGAGHQFDQWQGSREEMEQETEEMYGENQ